MSNPTSDKIFEVWLQVVLGMYVALCWPKSEDTRIHFFFVLDLFGEATNCFMISVFSRH